MLHTTRRALREKALRIANRAWVRLGGEVNGSPPALERIRRLIAGVSFPYLHIPIPGWLTLREQRTLYALAYTLPGPFLEIGSWAGRSTVCLAYGIRDSGAHKAFVSVDLNVTAAHFRPHGEQIGFFHPPSAAEPLDLVTEEIFRRSIEPLVTLPGGPMGLLRDNLRQRGLSELVHVINCDFRDAPRLAYRLIFCDIAHNPVEIERNMPALAPMLTAGTILACHDSSAANEACLRRQVPLGDSFTVDSLLVAQAV